MAKPPKSKIPVEAEELPDAWERFEKAVDTALHTKPQHREKKEGKKTKKK
jgi:hypothetical protein